MTWSVALRLGRVSNLPTVTSNVLAATMLSGRAARPWQLAVICVAMSMLYIAGMYLNDAFDREYDARERPDRPIPAGQVAALTVFGVGFGLLAGGVLVIALLCAVTASWPALVSVLALAFLIVVYDLHHKGNRYSPVIMGLCRVCVYTTTALAVAGSLRLDVIAGCACLLSYLIGLSYVARSENAKSIAQRWPLAFLSAPMLLQFPQTPVAWLVYIAFQVWVVRATALVSAGRMREAVTGLIAGIALLDALTIANHGGSALLVMIAVGAFALTHVFQRVIPGT